MRKESSLPVRLHPDEKQRLKAAAERLGLTTSAMVRLLVKSFVDEYARSDGRLALPPVWQSTDSAKKEPSRSDRAELLRVAEKRASYPANAHKPGRRS